MVLLLLSFFILGALTVVAVEAAGIWVLIRRLNRKSVREESKETDVPSVASSSVDVNPSLYRKQGNIWILEPERVPEIGMEDKVSADQRRRKEITEVTPVRKFANIKDHYLIVTELDGSTVQILLRGCTIFAVSATSLSTRKWAKKYPIKVESKGSAIYKGQKTMYLYLETSWEKESWCKALRLASCNDEEKKLFLKLSLDFQIYLASLTAAYPSFVKPFGGLNAESMDNSVKFDNSSSKVRQFLKKLGKKVPKGGHDSKGSGSLVSGYEDLKLGEKSRSFQDSILGNRIGKMTGTGRPSLPSFDDTSAASSNSSSAERDSRYLSSGTSNLDFDHMRFDEGSLCLNMLLSRLFFDFKNNLQSVSSVRNRIQRGLSNIRMPSYIGEVTCTAVDPGTLPPHILAMRALPSDMNEVWALEIDIEYLGETLLEIETRVEIQELEAEGEERRLDTPGVGEVTSDLLEECKCFGEQLELFDDTIADMKRQKSERDHDPEETENAKNSVTVSSQVPKWKSVLRSFSKHVSQVPISLGIKISSIRGTIRLCLKSPPSDQLWFGFTSMPDIDFNLESSFGDHKIPNGHLAVFLINRIKTGIRDTLVLPNRESIPIPWMLGEEDDWVSRKVAPFMWYKSNNNYTKCMSQTVEASKGTPEPNLEKSTIPHESSNPLPSSLSCIGELSSPLLEKDKLKEFDSTNKEDNIHVVHARSLALTDGNNRSNGEEEDESRFKRLGTRERMRGLGKKMGEKIEVKRRHIEEKGRNLVERMKGPP